MLRRTGRSLCRHKNEHGVELQKGGTCSSRAARVVCPRRSAVRASSTRWISRSGARSTARCQTKTIEGRRVCMGCAPSLSGLVCSACTLSTYAQDLPPCAAWSAVQHADLGAAFGQKCCCFHLVCCQRLRVAAGRQGGTVDHFYERPHHEVQLQDIGSTDTNHVERSSNPSCMATRAIRSALCSSSDTASPSVPPCISCAWQYPVCAADIKRMPGTMLVKWGRHLRHLRVPATQQVMCQVALWVCLQRRHRILPRSRRQLHLGCT